MNPCYGIKIRDSLFPAFFKRSANHRACARCMYEYGGMGWGEGAICLLGLS